MEKPAGKRNGRTAWLLLVLVLAAAFLLRWRLAGAPLERDEGEYAYGGQLLLQGVPPYAELYNMKLPGIYAVYAVILALLGQSATAIHLGLALVNTLSTLFLFLIGRLAGGAFAGLASAAAFALLSLGEPVQGIFANAEHFVLLPALAGLWLLLRERKAAPRLHLFGAGLLLGLGFLVKQQGAFFVVAGLLYTLFGNPTAGKGRWRRALAEALLLASAAALPWLAAALLLLAAGVFPAFWFWTVEYALAYSSQVPLGRGLGHLGQRLGELAGASPLLWLGAAAGLLLALARIRRPGVPRFLLLLALCAFLATCPGFFFRPHYFVLLLPAAALLFGGALGAGMALLPRSLPRLAACLPPLALLLCLAPALWLQRHFLFTVSPEEAARSIYWPNPFNLSPALADHIRRHSGPDDRVAVLGSEPQLFFLARRRSATGYIYMYPLMETHAYAERMQREMIAEVEAAKPKFLLYVRVSSSWLARPDSHRLVYEWFTRYREGYELVGLAEISPREDRLAWGKAMPKKPRTENWVALFRRRGG